MSYPPPPLPTPHDLPSHPSFNPSTPPPPPPKPSSTQQQYISPISQQPPALPPHPSQAGRSHAQWQDASRRPDVASGHSSQQQHAGRGPYQHEDAGNPAYTQQQRSDRPTPPDPGWVPDILLDKSNQDLSALLSNPSLLTALLQNPATTHPSIPSSLAPLSPLLTANQNLATHTLTLLSTVAAQRSHTLAHLHSVRALEQQWKKKQAELERKLEPWGPRELHLRLGQKIVEAEGVCRGVEESFLEADGGGVAGEREVGEWVRRVREGRRVVALRRERKARWDEGRVGGWR